MLPQVTNFSCTGHISLQEWIKEVIPSKCKPKAVFISDKIDFNPKMVIKMSIHQEDVTIINIYAPNNKYQNILIKYRT